MNYTVILVYFTFWGSFDCFAKSMVELDETGIVFDFKKKGRIRSDNQCINLNDVIGVDLQCDVFQY